MMLRNNVLFFEKATKKLLVLGPIAKLAPYPRLKPLVTPLLAV